MVSMGDSAVPRPYSNFDAPPTTPDWRWRYCLARIDRLEPSGDPEVFLDGPAADKLRSDPMMMDYLYPYLRYRLGCEAAHPLGDETVAAINQAMEAANEWAITPHSWSLRLEGGILARQPVGELMPSCDGGIPRLGQIVYEQFFFDIRPWLDNPRACAALLCADPNRVAERGAWDMRGKVVAYALGFNEFEKWRLGTPSRTVRSLCRDLEHDRLYLDGLRLLGLERPGDLSMVLGRRLKAARAGAIGISTYGHEAGYSPEQIEVLMKLMPGSPEPEGGMGNTGWHESDQEILPNA